MFHVSFCFCSCYRKCCALVNYSFFVNHLHPFLIQSYKVWILKTITETWNLFHEKFTALWDKNKNGPGEAYLSEIYNNEQVYEMVKQKYMKDLFHDSLGFGAAKMIRSAVNPFGDKSLLMRQLIFASKEI